MILDKGNSLPSVTSGAVVAIATGLISYAIAGFAITASAVPIVSALNALAKVVTKKPSPSDSLILPIG